MEPTPRLIRLVHDARNATSTPGGRVVVIGNFDGVHRGHQRVLARAASLPSAEPRPELTVLTFEPHPAAVLGASAPARLTRLSRKVDLLARHGVELVVAQAFDARFAALSPEQFVDVGADLPDVEGRLTDDGEHAAGLDAARDVDRFSGAVVEVYRRARGQQVRDAVAVGRRSGRGQPRGLPGLLTTACPVHSALDDFLARRHACRFPA